MAKVDLWFPALLGVNALYLASAALFLVNFASSRDTKGLANGALYAGFFLASALIFYESRVLGIYVPVASLAQALFFFSWSMVLIYLLLAWKIRLDTFGVILMPLILLMSGSALFVGGGDVAMRPYFASRWFAIHVSCAFLAYASFALSFVGALLYLVQNRELKAKQASAFYHKLPSLEALETAVYGTIVLGFPLLTAGLVSGFFWTGEVFGRLWHWEPKFILSIATWLIYLAILYAHYVRDFRGKNVVLVSILAFGFVLFTFLGVNYFEAGVHNFLR